MPLSGADRAPIARRGAVLTPSRELSNRRPAFYLCGMTNKTGPPVRRPQVRGPTEGFQQVGKFWAARRHRSREAGYLLSLLGRSATQICSSPPGLFHAGDRGCTPSGMDDKRKHFDQKFKSERGPPGSQTAHLLLAGVDQFSALALL